MRKLPFITNLSLIFVFYNAIVYICTFDIVVFIILRCNEEEYETADDKGTA